MRYAPVIFAGLLLSPSFAFAAGFAKQSLFLSKTPVTEGDTVLVHAVVDNSDSIPFTGELIFYTAQGSSPKNRLGSVAVSIAPGGANTESVSWKPAAGDYTVTADLAQPDGTVVEEESAQFTVAAKPVPVNVASDTSAVGSSQSVQDAIAKVSPQAAAASTPVFGAIDSFRVKAASLIGNGIRWSQGVTSSKPAGEVLGAATQSPTPQGIMGALTYFAAMGAMYALSILLWIVTNAGVFYPVLAFLFLYALWALYRRMRRPSYY